MPVPPPPASSGHTSLVPRHPHSTGGIGEAAGSAGHDLHVDNEQQRHSHGSAQHNGQRASFTRLPAGQQEEARPPQRRLTGEGSSADGGAMLSTPGETGNETQTRHQALEATQQRMRAAAAAAVAGHKQQQRVFEAGPMTAPGRDEEEGRRKPAERTPARVAPPVTEASEDLHRSARGSLDASSTGEDGRVEEKHAVGSMAGPAPLCMATVMQEDATTRIHPRAALASPSTHAAPPGRALPAVDSPSSEEKRWSPDSGPPGDHTLVSTAIRKRRAVTAPSGTAGSQEGPHSSARHHGPGDSKRQEHSETPAAVFELNTAPERSAALPSKAATAAGKEVMAKKRLQRPAVTANGGQETEDAKPPSPIRQRRPRATPAPGHVLDSQGIRDSTNGRKGIDNASPGQNERSEPQEGKEKHTAAEPIRLRRGIKTTVPPGPAPASDAPAVPPGTAEALIRKENARIKLGRGLQGISVGKEHLHSPTKPRSPTVTVSEGGGAEPEAGPPQARMQNEQPHREFVQEPGAEEAVTKHEEPAEVSVVQEGRDRPATSLAKNLQAKPAAEAPARSQSMSGQEGELQRKQSIGAASSDAEVEPPQRAGTAPGGEPRSRQKSASRKKEMQAKTAKDRLRENPRVKVRTTNWQLPPSLPSPPSPALLPFWCPLLSSSPTLLRGLIFQSRITTSAPPATQGPPPLSNVPSLFLGPPTGPESAGDCEDKAGGRRSAKTVPPGGAPSASGNAGTLTVANRSPALPPKTSLKKQPPSAKEQSSALKASAKLRDAPPRSIFDGPTSPPGAAFVSREEKEKREKKRRGGSLRRRLLRSCPARSRRQGRLGRHPRPCRPPPRHARRRPSRLLAPCL